MTQRDRILLVELLHVEYAHAHSTNGMRYRCSGTGPLVVSILQQTINKMLYFLVDVARVHV